MDRNKEFETWLSNHDIKTLSLWNAFLEGHRIGYEDGKARRKIKSDGEKMSGNFRPNHLLGR